MMRTQNWVVTTSALAIVLAFGRHALAEVRQLECREWTDKSYRGLYSFSVDATSLSASYQPQGENFLFGKSVKEWKLIWTDGHNYVFSGMVPEDWTGPVKMLSLDFSKVRMFTYSLGGALEGDAVVSVTERECRRID